MPERTTRPLPLLVVALVLLPASLRATPPVEAAGEVPEHHVADPKAPAVTAQNLLASERFWPYQVELTRAWTPPGASQPIASGTRGVLIRVDRDARARVDFGRGGIHEVPVAATDLVALSNQVRTGELEKMAANFVLAIGPRLLDASAVPVQTYPFHEATRYRRFLCVFADASDRHLPALAKSLAPLREQSDLLVILFPQGQVADAELGERLHRLGGPAVFVHDHLSEAYTRTLVDEPLALPLLLLQTDEGRVLFQGPWEEILPPGLLLALGASAPPGASIAGATPAR